MNTCQRRHVLRALWAALAVVVLAACGQERPKDQYNLVEYVGVEGSCSEDHVRQSGKYIGSIVHWHNITKDTEMRYGAVTRWEQINESIDQVQNPNKYFLPFSIEFTDVPAEDLRRSSFTAKGVSTHITGGDVRGPQYQATCQLTVVKRSPTLPPASERR